MFLKLEIIHLSEYVSFEAAGRTMHHQLNSFLPEKKAQGVHSPEARASLKDCLVQKSDLHREAQSPSSCTALPLPFLDFALLDSEA